MTSFPVSTPHPHPPPETRERRLNRKRGSNVKERETVVFSYCYTEEKRDNEHLALYKQSSGHIEDPLPQSNPHSTMRRDNTRSYKTKKWTTDSRFNIV